MGTWIIWSLTATIPIGLAIIITITCTLIQMVEAKRRTKRLSPLHRRLLPSALWEDAEWTWAFSLVRATTCMRICGTSSPLLLPHQRSRTRCSCSASRSTSHIGELLMIYKCLRSSQVLIARCCRKLPYSRTISLSSCFPAPHTLAPRALASIHDIPSAYTSLHTYILAYFASCCNFLAIIISLSGIRFF